MIVYQRVDLRQVSSLDFLMISQFQVPEMDVLHN